MRDLRGTFTALVTPFKDNKIDYKSVDRLLRQQLEGDVSGFVINGTTGESPTLSASETEELFRFARTICGSQTTLIVGTGTNNTVQSIENSKRAQEVGADAILAVVPYYNKPPQRGLYEHFRSIATAIKIPTILYNVPGRTITSLETETIADLAKVPGIVGIKEASGKIDFAKSIINACGKDFIMLSGDDGTYVDFLQAGGHGVISVASHLIPKQMVQWKSWVASGQGDLARAEMLKYQQLIDLLFIEANPIPVKKALALMGLLDSGELRLPLVELAPNHTEKLMTEMQRVGVL